MLFSGNQLETDEEVVAALQDHWIVMIIPLFAYMVGWIIFLFLLYVAGLIKIPSPITGFILSFIAFFILITAHHLFFLYFIEYLVSSLIITNKRIIEIRFFPFFVDDVSYIELAEIHELDKRKHGILRNVLNYGDVSLNLPRRRETITFQYVRYPSKFINLIEGLKDHRDITQFDIKSMGASCSKKYKFLLEESSKKDSNTRQN